MLSIDTYIARIRAFSNLPSVVEMTIDDRRDFLTAEDHFASMVREQPKGGADIALFVARERYMKVISHFHGPNADPEAMSDAFKSRCLDVLTEPEHDPAPASSAPFFLPLRVFFRRQLGAEIS